MAISVIINPGAGPAGRREPAERLVAWTHAWMAARELDGTVDVIAGPGDAERMARAAVARGADVVVAWGGDGTVNGVASALVGTGIPLGIVPVGSGNGLARELGVPTRREEALTVAVSGPVRTIDAGELNGRLFFNVAGIGFDAHVAHVFASQTGHTRGFWAYLSTILREIFRYAPSRYVVSSEDAAVARDGAALFISIANTRQWGNGAQIAPFAVVDDGRLDFVLIDARPPSVIIPSLLRLYNRTVAKIGGTVMSKVVAVTLTATPAAPLHLDGEPFEPASEIHVRVRPAALHVRVPR